MTNQNTLLILFDLDGTLAESKSPIDDEMGELLRQLLERKMVAVISGGALDQFMKQVVDRMPSSARFENIILFPTCGTQCYRFVDSRWQKIYADFFSHEERGIILAAFNSVFAQLSYVHPSTVWGDVIEDRGSQVTFSALGQRAPREHKDRWHQKNNAKRLEIRSALERLLPQFEVRVGGLTSVDVTKKGFDKGYGICKAEELLGISKNEMLFIGDALYEGGNDYAAVREGLETIAVKNPEETKEVICRLL